MMSNLLDNLYRVTSVLGSGGFGETYLAEDTKMPSNRRCVIKQLKPVVDNPQMYGLLQQRFQREAAVLENLGEESRYIPKLYANFVENGLFYLVQEWIDGLTLAEKIERDGKWKEEAVKALLVSALHTLRYVHDRGIIHRDIKPDNIILRNDEPVLIDFGAVKETLNVSTIGGAKQQVHSIVIGTPGFMASEQAAGRPFFASDLYSLALTAIFALTGKYPQQLGTDSQTGEVLWRSQVTGISAELKAVFDKALQFDPRDRYGSAKEMLQALQGSISNPILPTQSLPNQVIPVASPAISTMQTVAVTPRGYAAPVSQQSLESAQSVYVYKSPKTSRSKVMSQILATVIAGSAIGAMIALGVMVSQNGGISSFWNKIFATNSQGTKTPFYFLADSAFEEEEKANLQVEKLRSLGYKDAGKFWIPDYPNLGKSQLFQVYASKFTSADSCSTKLQEHSKLVSDAYCAFASLNASDSVQRVAGATPTPIPTSTPSPSPTITATPLTVSKPAPDQFIREYYQLVRDRQLDKAWQYLTPRFQSDRAGGYQSFTEWWTSNKVMVNGSRVVEIKENSAIVDIDLAYQRKKEIFPETLRMTLVWDEKLAQWQIAETNRQ